MTGKGLKRSRSTYGRRLRVFRTLLPVIALCCAGVTNLTGPATSGAIASTATYLIQDLGTLGGVNSHAYAVTGGGDVVGYSETSSSATRAFLWGVTPAHPLGKMTSLGTLAGGSSSTATGVNATDEVIGNAGTTSGVPADCLGNDEATHAFRWIEGTGMTDLGTLQSDGCGISFATGINDAGDVVGHGNTAAERDDAFLYTGGPLTDLNTLLPANSGWDSLFDAAAINDSGQIAGSGALSNGAGVEAFLWNHVTAPGSVPIVLGTLTGGRFSSATGINASGWVIGYADTATENHAFLDRTSRAGRIMIDLGTLPGDGNSEAYGIDLSGDVVGSSGDTDGIGGHAFLYSGGVMTDLNTVIPADSGWVLNSARGINDAGQIAGYGTIGGATHAFLLTPLSAGPTTTTTTVTSSQNPSTYGQSVDFTASVSPSTATGTVQFEIDGTNAGSPVTLVDGSAGSSPTASLDVASSPLTITAVYTPSDSAAYSGSSGTVSQTVDPAPLTITADDISMTYGDAPPGFTADYSGFANSEDSNVLSPKPSCTATDGHGNAISSGTPAGTYTDDITCSGAADPNYAISYLPGTLAINRAPLTVTANDATRVYGQPNPDFTAGYQGFVNGDGPGSLSGSLTVTTAATSASPVGSYDITPGGLTSGNYAITYLPGTLAITPATLTVTADNQSKVYGQPNPPLTVSYSGFVNGDTAAVLSGSPLCTTPAITTSPPGSYPITCTAGSLTAQNYSFTFVPGSLDVSYGACLLYDPAKPANSGSTIPIKLTLCDAGGKNLSSSSLTLRVIGLAPGRGSANPGGAFRFDPKLAPGGGYIYNLNTTGYAGGSYDLLFTATGDPTTHHAPFTIR